MKSYLTIIEKIIRKKIFKVTVLLLTLIFIFPLPWIGGIVLCVKQSFPGWVWVAIFLFILPILVSTVIGYILFAVLRKVQKHLEENQGFSELFKSTLGIEEEKKDTSDNISSNSIKKGFKESKPINKNLAKEVKTIDEK